MQFNEHKINLNNQSARYYQVPIANNAQSEDGHQSTDNQSTDKPQLHFYGGNGFPVGVYQPLLTRLSQHFVVSSLAMRGYWHDKPTAKALTREEDADMLIEFLQATQTQPIVAVGHSQGATATAMAAAKRPELFRAVYLIEPVTFTKAQAVLYECLPRFIKQRYEPFKGTLQKQTHWDSIDDYYQHLRGHRAYKRVSDENLWIYASHSLVASTQGNGYELLFSPEQELANYHGKTPFIDNALKELNHLGVPYQLITGKPNIFISEKVRQAWAKFVDEDKIITLPEYGHLLPVEAPELVADLIIPLPSE